MMSWIEIGSCFMILFAVIDIIGSIPIIIDIQTKTGNIQPYTTTFVSMVLMIVFLIGGESILSIFGWMYTVLR